MVKEMDILSLILQAREQANVVNEDIATDILPTLRTYQRAGDKASCTSIL